LYSSVDTSTEVWCSATIGRVGAIGVIGGILILDF